MDDLQVSGALHIAVLRSMHAHARIQSIDVEKARSMPGVIAVLTAADLGDAHRAASVPPFEGLCNPRGPLPLARDVVRYTGEPLAFVVAENRYRSEDALEAIEVEVEPLPCVTDVEEAARPDAPLVHADLTSNLVGNRAVTVGEPDSAFAEAEVTVKLQLRLSRGHGQPLETRGCVAWRDAETGILHVITATQAPFRVRKVVAEALGLPQEMVHVQVPPNVGGGFGVKGPAYPEEIMVSFAAMQMNRPVKWVEDRREHFVASYHDREQVHQVEIAATREGKLVALRDHFQIDTGAYSAQGLLIANNCVQHLVGMYQIPHLDIAYECYYSHRTPCGSWRGAGRPQGAYVIERAMDALARELKLDPMEIRRRNLIPADAFPYDTGLPNTIYDSGNYQPIVERISALRNQFRMEASVLRSSRFLVGVGAACYAESTAASGAENARIQFNADGDCTIYVSSPSQGQGHEATWRRLITGQLGIKPEQVTVVAGDTATLPDGIGTFGSRIVTLIGSATLLAVQEIANSLRTEAAARLECDPADVVLAGDVAHPQGAPAHRIAMRSLVEALSPGGVLTAAKTFSSKGGHWAAGGQVGMVAIDVETGQIRVSKYVALDDCGEVLEPDSVAGQVIGAVAQGIGNTILEQLVYDESGQLQTGSYMDYLLPTATDIPTIELEHTCTPSPLNPLGTKGAGEGGIMPVAAVLAAALEDAFAAEGARVDAYRFPISPEEIWRWLGEVNR